MALWRSRKFGYSSCSRENFHPRSVIRTCTHAQLHVRITRVYMAVLPRHWRSMLIDVVTSHTQDSTDGPTYDCAGFYYLTAHARTSEVSSKFRTTKINSDGHRRDSTKITRYTVLPPPDPSSYLSQSSRSYKCKLNVIP